MGRTLANELPMKAGERVRMLGWLHHQRQLAHVAFVLLRDRSGIAQVVVVDAAAREAVSELMAETVIEVEGVVIANDSAPNGVEVGEPTISVVSAAAATPPFELRRPTINAQLPTLLDHAAVS